MNEKIKSYIDTAFAEAPKTRRAYDLRDELYANMLDKYNDLKNKGYSDEDAYNNVVDGMGDINELVARIREDSTQDDGEMRRDRKKNAALISVCVFLYFSALILLAILEELTDLPDAVSLVTFLGICAISTCLLIYNALSRPDYLKKNDTVVEEFKHWQAKTIRRKNTLKSVFGIIWTLTVALYFILSFGLGIWAYSWVIFIIAAAVTQIIKLIFNSEGD